jgi:hypothetical protein
MPKEGGPMKYFWLAVLFVGTALTAAPADFAGTWKLRFTGPNAPKTIGSIILDLKIEGNAVTGTARIGVWPGDAPITVSAGQKVHQHGRFGNAPQVAFWARRAHDDPGVRKHGNGLKSGALDQNIELPSAPSTGA